MKEHTDGKHQSSAITERQVVTGQRKNSHTKEKVIPTQDPGSPQDSSTSPPSPRLSS